MKKLLVSLAVVLGVFTAASAYADPPPVGMVYPTAFHCNYRGYLSQALPLSKYDESAAVLALQSAIRNGDCIASSVRVPVEVLEVLSDISWVVDNQHGIYGVKIKILDTVRYSFYVEGA